MGLPRLLRNRDLVGIFHQTRIINVSEALESLDPGDHQKKIRVRTFADNGDTGFETKDNGVGIDQEIIEHRFDFGNSYQRTTGLGLYYRKLFLEDNRGRSVEAVPAAAREQRSGQLLKNILDYGHINEVLKKSSKFNRK